jgi:hypothetical protein
MNELPSNRPPIERNVAIGTNRPTGQATFFAGASKPFLLGTLNLPPCILRRPLYYIVFIGDIDGSAWYY